MAGQITLRVTEGISRLMVEKSERFTEFISDSVVRHLNHDWGKTDKYDAALNNQYPESAMSTYVSDDGVKIWVKSENGYIVVLLPSEY